MIILITGASRGMGLAIAKEFAAHGYDLLLSARNENRLLEVAASLQTSFPSIRVAAKAIDLAERGSAHALGKWVLDMGVVPDVVINNAGIFEPGNVSNEPEGVLEAQLQLNLLSAYHLTRILLPAMKLRRSGHIFNMCSIASLKSYDNGGAYSISKFALYGFSQNLRHELKSQGIKVTSVLPGAVFTDSWKGFDNSDHRIMEPEDIAKLVFTASQLSEGACVEDIVVRPQLGDL